VLTAAKLLIEVNLVLKLRAQLVHDRNNRKRNASYKPVLPAATGTHRTRTNKERN